MIKNIIFSSSYSSTLNKLFLTFLLLAFLPFFAQAQRPNNDRMEAMKIAFFTQKLDLSSEEAKIFWPIYNDYNKEQSELRRARFQKMISFKKTTEIDELSDTEIQTLILNDFDFRQRELNVDRKYYNKLKSSLPIKIVGKYYRAQEAFKKELLNKFRQQNQKTP